MKQEENRCVSCGKQHIVDIIEVNFPYDNVSVKFCRPCFKETDGAIIELTERMIFHRN